MDDNELFKRALSIHAAYNMVYASIKVGATSPLPASRIKLTAGDVLDIWELDRIYQLEEAVHG